MTARARSGTCPGLRVSGSGSAVRIDLPPSCHRRISWRREGDAVDIADWLRGLGLERYEQAFRENEIDLRVLPELTADDLKELGVTAIGHRRLLLKAIAGLGAGPGRAPAEAA